MEQGILVQLGRRDEAQKSSVPRGIDIDVAILKPKHKMVGAPFLPIKKTHKAKLYDEIAMCGYPMGDYSLRFLTEEVLELRLSPVMQFGRITGILPADNTEFPTAIQTDIVGTAASSGSPIVDLDSGEVTAIAQKVILAELVGNTKIDALAKIGLVFGAHHGLLKDIPERARRHFEENVPFESSVNLTQYRHGGSTEVNKTKSSVRTALKDHPLNQSQTRTKWREGRKNC